MEVEFISFALGYAEESSVANLIFRSRVGPLHLDQALETLAGDLYAFYAQECINPQRPCCKAAGDVKFCPECGNQDPSKAYDDYYYGFREFLWKLLSYSADDYGGGWEDVQLPDGSWHEMIWQYCHVPDMLRANKENCLHFGECGEDIMVMLNRVLVPGRFEDYEERHWLTLDKAIEEAKL